MSRVCACSVPRDLFAETATSTFTGDRARRVGQPERIVMDFGPPGLFGPARNNISHVYGIQLIAAPQREYRQNGLPERSSRSLKTATKATTTDGNAEHGQNAPTQASIARNHGQRSTAGIPPALSMTGRADLLSGCAASIWNRDPSDDESLVVKQQQALGNITDARNASISGYSKQALRRAISRNLPDRASIHIPIGAGAKIADRGKWICEYRAIALSAGNVIVERGSHQLKWKNKNFDYPIRTTTIPLITRSTLKLSKMQKIYLANGKLIATQSIFPTTKIANMGDRVSIAETERDFQTTNNGRVKSTET